MSDKLNKLVRKVSTVLYDSPRYATSIKKALENMSHAERGRAIFQLEDALLENERAKTTVAMLKSIEAPKRF